MLRGVKQQYMLLVNRTPIYYFVSFVGTVLFLTCVVHCLAFFSIPRLVIGLSWPLVFALVWLLGWLVAFELPLWLWLRTAARYCRT